MKFIRIQNCFLLLISIIRFGYAQSPDENIFKYWVYRDRLLSEFVVPGIAPGWPYCIDHYDGHSLPASERNFDTDRDLNHPVERITWSDSPQSLGWYIAVLATEFENGKLDVGEMQKLQMQKIEELTLYVLQLKKEIDELKAKNK